MSKAAYFFLSLVVSPNLARVSSKTFSRSCSRCSSNLSRDLLVWFEVWLRHQAHLSVKRSISLLLTHIFFSISTRFFFCSKLASILLDSCLTIFPYVSTETTKESTSTSSLSICMKDHTHLLNRELLICLDFDLTSLLESLLLDEGSLKLRR